MTVRGPRHDRTGDALARGVEMLRGMWLIRAFEERVIELYHEGQLPGLIHVSIGQEAVAVGVGAALAEGDYVYGTHRSHGHFLARGADPDRMMAELAGRATGYCQGRGGSMHLVAAERRRAGGDGRRRGHGATGPGHKPGVQAGGRGEGGGRLLWRRRRQHRWIPRNR